MTHRVVLVDDQEEIRTGLSDLIRSRPGFEVVGTAGTASEALELLGGVETDLVVADLILGDGPDGIQLTKGIKARDPFVPVLVLSGRHESLFAERALLAGASGYLMKDQAMDVLFEAMETATNRGVWLSKDMEERLLPRTILAYVDPSIVQDELGLQLMEELRRGNRTVGGLSRVLSQPLGVVERGLDAIQGQLKLPSRAALLLYLR